jgi:hypothetical protein
LKLKDILLDLFGPPSEPGRSVLPCPAPAGSQRPARGSARVDSEQWTVDSKPSPPAADQGGNERSEDTIAAVLRRFGAPYQRVLFTRNRRTMISVGRDRSLLRLHQAFASADDAVLGAVAVLYTAGTRGRRKAEAKRTVQRFIDAIPVEAAEPRPRRRRREEGDEAWLARLQGEFDKTNREQFRGRLPRVPLHLSRAMRRRNGHFSPRPLEIVISWRLCVHGAPGEAEQTVRHEMIHLWQYLEGVPVDHGPAFRRMAHRLDVHPRATREVRWK